MADPISFAEILDSQMDMYAEAIQAEAKSYLDSPFHKIMMARTEEMNLLYGNMDNYFMMKDYM